MTEIDGMAKLPRTQVERLRFLEAQLLFHRRIVIKQLIEEFGITRPVASNDIKTYMSLFPDNIKPYSATDKCFRPYPQFSPKLISEVASFDRALSKGGLDNNAYVGQVPFLERIQPHGVISALLAAIENQYVIEAIYSSVKNPVGHKRTILPTKLIRASNRLHVRAYCFEHNSYRDFSISRFNTIPRKTSTRLNVSELPYDDGIKKVPIIVVPNAKLSKKVQALIGYEFQIEQERTYEVEAFVVQYFLQDNLLPSNDAEYALSTTEPYKYPVVVKNWATVKKCLFANNKE
ncbi:hypothetical protein CWI84_02200 [Idiomarina tyrosinivorans]|uniref:Uncharacterized protein n=1 Tax=Idiomarina tyrosinivorans TaxID=1445662 RepID=A0A432ZT30_9GAMM|nr:WYL domain-containing protein [Idiomarina tyrosinivorans]RUO80946.1 hypothetical protein CWI84_02200 [Idiomarina tyrosinivorans]